MTGRSTNSATASHLSPIGLLTEPIEDHLVDVILSQLNERLFHLGIRAELAPAAEAGQDLVILGRVALVD